MEQLVNVEDPDLSVTGKQEENVSTLSANGMLHVLSICSQSFR